jgi:hypothetical protein
MRAIRPAVVLIALATCILVISFSFISYYGQVDQPSPLLNTNMKFWTLDLANNITKPYLWEVDIIKGPFDNVSIYQANVENRVSVALRLGRSNQNNTSVWTTLHVRQDLSGQGLDALFRSTISLWVFPTFTYAYDKLSHNPENAFGIEINDGTNLIWFIFADEPSQVFRLPHHRIVLAQTPLNTWSQREVDIARQYEEAGWKKPQSLSFILLIGTTGGHPGDWVGYVSGLSVDVAPLQTESLSLSQQLTVLAVDVVAMLAIAGTAIGFHARKKKGRVRRRR